MHDECRAGQHDHGDTDDEHGTAHDADGDALGDLVCPKERMLFVEHQ